MKYCVRCGAQLYDEAVVCPKCGCGQPGAAIKDSGSAGWGVLGFFFPLIGFILYLCWMNNRPRSAKSAGKGALISIIVAVALVVLFFIIGVGTYRLSGIR